MAKPGYTLFDTAIGRMGIAWSERGVIAAQLPEADDGATRARLVRKAPDAEQAQPPSQVQGAIDGIVELLEGRPADLSPVELDLAELPDFNRRVYQVARTIPAGSTRSYGEIANELGGVEFSRDVGQALGENPIPVIVPCHRVIAADGKLGGFSANGGPATKRRMLSIEGAPAAAALTLFEAPS